MPRPLCGSDVTISGNDSVIPMVAITNALAHDATPGLLSAPEHSPLQRLEAEQEGGRQLQYDAGVLQTTDD